MSGVLHPLELSGGLFKVRRGKGGGGGRGDLGGFMSVELTFNYFQIRRRQNVFMPTYGCFNLSVQLVNKEHNIAK